MTDPLAEFRDEINKAVWAFLQVDAVVTTDFFGKRQQVVITDINRAARSQTGIMVKFRGGGEHWYDAAWFKPVKEGDRP